MYQKSCYKLGNIIVIFKNSIGMTKEMNGVLGHFCAHIGYTGPGEHLEDGKVNEISGGSKIWKRGSARGFGGLPTIFFWWISANLGNSLKYLAKIRGEGGGGGRLLRLLPPGPATSLQTQNSKFEPWRPSPRYWIWVWRPLCTHNTTDMQINWFREDRMNIADLRAFKSSKCWRRRI